MKPLYSQFSLHDFVLDDAFRQWVFQPDGPDRAFWQTFLEKHPEQQTTLREAAAVLLHLRATYDSLTPASQERIFQVLDQRFNEQRPRQPFTQLFRWRLSSQSRFTRRLAASLAGLAMLAGTALWYTREPHQQRIHTAYGENRTVTLPDGSTVLLNGNSTLVFAPNWAAGQPREVWLDGEGFFKVTKQPLIGEPAGRLAKGAAIKFVTHTPGLDITVLGTQFNVNTRRGNTDVTLVEGKVQLIKPGTPSGRVIEMRPGQFASAQPTIETVDVRTDKPLLHTSWTQHQFVFENTALSDIAGQLRDTYGIDLVFEDNALAGRRFTGNLSNQDIETLLTTLSLTFDLDAQRTGNRITLRRNH